MFCLMKSCDRLQGIGHLAFYQNLPRLFFAILHRYYFCPAFLQAIFLVPMSYCARLLFPHSLARAHSLTEIFNGWATRARGLILSLAAKFRVLSLAIRHCNSDGQTFYLMSAAPHGFGAIAKRASNGANKSPVGFYLRSVRFDVKKTP